MKTKYKFTGFAKFFFFMIFFLPGSYLGLSLYKGEITMNELADKFNYKFTINTDKEEDPSERNCSEIIQLKDKEIQLLKERIQLLETTN